MSAFHGVLNLDKPAGLTSRDAVNAVQRQLGRGKIGHAGTLDPLATGVLVVCVGAATRLIRLVQEMPKTYEAEFLLGCSSETDDIEGEVRPRDVPLPDAAAVEEALPHFVGRVQQRPPAYSAIKVQGKRAYELARRGDEVRLASREVRIDAIELLRYEPPRLQLRVHCGSGVYIRSIGRDLGERLGCGAVMSGLRRTAIGCFEAAEAVSVDQLDSADAVRQALQPMARAAAQLPTLTLDDASLTTLAHGQELPGAVPRDEHCAVVDSQGELRAIAKGVGGGRLRAAINLPRPD